MRSSPTDPSRPLAAAAGLLTVLTVVAAITSAVLVATRSGDDHRASVPEDEDPPVVRAVPLDGSGAEVVWDLALADLEVLVAVDLGPWVLADVGAPDDADRLVVLDPETGDRVSEWPVPAGGFAHVEDGVRWSALFVVPVSGPEIPDQVVALDVATGTVAWTMVVGEGPLDGRVTSIEQVLAVDDQRLAVVETVAEGTAPGTPHRPQVRFLDRTGAVTAVSPPLEATSAPAGSIVLAGEVVVVLRGRALPVRPDGSVGGAVALPVCALAVGPAEGGLLVAGATGSDCSRDRSELDSERVVLVDWPSGTAVWDVAVSTQDRPATTPRLLATPARSVVALSAPGPGGAYVTAVLDPDTGEALWDRPAADVLVGPDGGGLAIGWARDPGRIVLTPLDLGTGERAGGPPVDTGSADLPAGLTATHVIVDRGPV